MEVELPDLPDRDAFLHHGIDSGYVYADFDVNDIVWAWHQDGANDGNFWFKAQIRSKQIAKGTLTIRFADTNYDVPGYHPSEVSLEDRNENEDFDLLQVIE